MTTGAGDRAERAAASTSDGWADVRADDSIQYAPVNPPPPPERPEWLRDLLDWLSGGLEPLGQAFGSAWPVVKWLMIVLAIGGALFLLWRVLEPLLLRDRPSPPREVPWAPERGAALALLEDADRLAAEGRYDEATHLLLQRSVGELAAARRGWVEPSSTARELARLEELPESARRAFGVIAGRVESSLFALRSLAQEDWLAARAAYAEFALNPLSGESRGRPS